MTTIDTHPDATTVLADRAHGTSSLIGWVTTADHKRIGRLFIGGGLLAVAGALVIGALAGLERVDPDSFDIFKASTAGQVIALQRTLLVYGAVVPLLLGLAVAIVPLQLGARALAFPRLALAGFYAWLFGVGLVIVATANNGGPSGTDGDFGGLFLTAMVLIGVGLLAAALSVVTSILTTRTPGMSMLRAPLFSWASFVGAVSLLLTLPVLIGDLIYLFVDYRHAQAAFGGSDGFTAWMGWALTHPEVLVLAIPALGIVAELFAVSARVRPPQRPVLFVGIGLLAIAAVSAATQVAITLPWDGNEFFEHFGDKLADLLTFAFFQLLPLLGLVIVLGIGGLAMKTGRPRVIAPLVFAIFGLLLILAGAAGGVAYNIDDTKLAGTIFEEGASTAVALGAVLIAMGGVAYWGPKLWGRRLPDKPLLGLAVLGAGAAALAAGPYFIAGFAKQPSGALGGFDYSGSPELWNVLAAVGYAATALIVLAFAALAVRGFTNGEPAGDDPWDGQTLEWATTSPPPEHNFVELRAISSPEPLLDLKPTPVGASRQQGADD